MNKADNYSKVNAILSYSYNSVSFIMMLTNTVNCEARRCISREWAKKSFNNKLFLIINIFQFTFRDKNNLIIMYGLLNVHGLPCKFLVSILDLLTRNQFSVKKILCFAKRIATSFPTQRTHPHCYLCYNISANEYISR